MRPKFSIITPSFNQAQFLEETILSVIKQDYPNLEYIIIDGGSTDGSVEIIKKYEQHLAYWISEKDNGQAEAINKGFKKATGEIISWLNSDDLLFPGTLQKVSNLFHQNPSVDFIHGKTILFGKEKKEIITEATENDFKYRALAGMPYSQPSCFFRKKVLEEQGFLNENFHYAMDYDLFIRIALNYEMLKSNEIYSRYRLHEKSKSVFQNMEFAHEWAAVFSKVLRSFDFSKDIINQMKKLKLYKEGEDKFNVSKNFSKQDLEKAFLYFLEYQVHAYYENLNLKRAKDLIMFIKKFNFVFYKKKNLNTVLLKSSFLNKFSIRFFRNFTR